MYVQQFNRHCNLCNKLVESSYKDIPIGEINLSPFPVPCECGYFYVAEHQTVSFDKWKIFISRLKGDKEYIKKSITIEEEFIKEHPQSCSYSKRQLLVLNPRLEEVEKLIALNSIPIPNHLFID